VTDLQPVFDQFFIDVVNDKILTTRANYPSANPDMLLHDRADFSGEIVGVIFYDDFKV
jgi:hypothetical protein